MPKSTPISELSVPVSGGRLAAFRFGVERPGAPLVLAVHGITGNSRAWLPVARALDTQGTVVAVDLRGRGRSNELPPPYGVEAHAHDLLAVLDHLGVERAVLAGHSLGAYIVALFASQHPQRVHAAVLVDGGLTIPGSRDVDPQEFADAFLGPAIARLKLTFPNHAAYIAWWRQHPSFSPESDVSDEDLAAYANYDLVGEEPEMHSSVLEQAVRGDAGDLADMGRAAHLLEVRAKLLCAPLGLLNEPNPMQPIELVEAWVEEDPQRRSAELVPDVNHYSITMGEAGARAVADTIAACVPQGLRS